LRNPAEILGAANRLIKKYNTRDPFRLADELGIMLRYSDSLGSLLGLYTVVLRNRVIILNSDLGENQRRMVLAHELGHDVLHREAAKTGLQEYMLFDMRTPTEYEANAFAAHLLIDRDELIELSKERELDPWSVSRELGLNVNLVLIKFAEMNRMGDSFTLPRIPDATFFKNELPGSENAF